MDCAAVSPDLVLQRRETIGESGYVPELRRLDHEGRNRQFRVAHAIGQRPDRIHAAHQLERDLDSSDDRLVLIILCDDEVVATEMTYEPQAPPTCHAGYGVPERLDRFVSGGESGTLTE